MLVKNSQEIERDIQSKRSKTFTPRINLDPKNK